MQALQSPEQEPRREINGVRLHHDSLEDFTVYETAPFWERLLAMATDYFVLGIAVAVLRLPFLKMFDQASFDGQAAKAASIVAFLNFLAFILTHTGPIFLWGQTLGKAFFGLRVVTDQGSARLTFAQVLLREVVGKFISYSLFGFGFLLPLWRSDRKALHDIMSETKLVKHRL